MTNKKEQVVKMSILCKLGIHKWRLYSSYNKERYKKLYDDIHKGGGVRSRIAIEMLIDYKEWIECKRCGRGKR